MCIESVMLFLVTSRLLLVEYMHTFKLFIAGSVHVTCSSTKNKKIHSAAKQVSPSTLWRLKEPNFEMLRLKKFVKNNLKRLLSSSHKFLND